MMISQSWLLLVIYKHLYYISMSEWKFWSYKVTNQTGIYCQMLVCNRLKIKKNSLACIKKYLLSAKSVNNTFLILWTKSCFQFNLINNLIGVFFAGLSKLDFYLVASIFMHPLTILNFEQFSLLKSFEQVLFFFSRWHE